MHKTICAALIGAAVIAAGTATVAMAQGVNNTGYSRDWYNGYPQYGAYYGNPAYRGYYGYGDRYNYDGNNYGYGSSDQRGWGSGRGFAYDRGYDSRYWGR